MEKKEKRRSNECELQAGRDPVQRVLRFIEIEPTPVL
jgi:hypothetical protein